MQIFRSFFLILCSVMIVAAQARAQSPAQSPRPTFPPPPAQSVAAAIDQELDHVERDIIGVADAMPADKYNFAPESLAIPGSNYKGVRSFAMQVIHIAAANYLYWSGVAGEKIPDGIIGPNPADSLKTKEASMKLLRDSFALGHRAIATLTAENELELVPIRNAKQTRLFLATWPMVHAYDIYGQMVEYLRMNGKVPPASQPRDY
jgi:hypothetical protein